MSDQPMDSRIQEVLAREQCGVCERAGRPTEWVFLRVTRDHFNSTEAGLVFACRACHVAQVRRIASEAEQALAKQQESIEHWALRLQDARAAIAAPTVAIGGKKGGELP